MDAGDEWATETEEWFDVSDEVFTEAQEEFLNALDCEEGLENCVEELVSEVANMCDTNSPDWWTG